MRSGRGWFRRSTSGARPATPRLVGSLRAGRVARRSEVVCSVGRSFDGLEAPGAYNHPSALDRLRRGAYARRPLTPAPPRVAMSLSAIVALGEDVFRAGSGTLPARTKSSVRARLPDVADHDIAIGEPCGCPGRILEPFGCHPASRADVSDPAKGSSMTMGADPCERECHTD